MFSTPNPHQYAPSPVMAYRILQNKVHNLTGAFVTFTGTVKKLQVLSYSYTKESACKFFESICKSYESTCNFQQHLVTFLTTQCGKPSQGRFEVGHVWFRTPRGGGGGGGQNVSQEPHSPLKFVADRLN